MEMKYEQGKLFTLFDTAGRNPRCGPQPFPQILLGDLFIYVYGHFTQERKFSIYSYHPF